MGTSLRRELQGASLPGWRARTAHMAENPPVRVGQPRCAGFQRGAQRRRKVRRRSRSAFANLVALNLRCFTYHPIGFRGDSPVTGGGSSLAVLEQPPEDEAKAEAHPVRAAVAAAARGGDHQAAVTELGDGPDDRAPADVRFCGDFSFAPGVEPSMGLHLVYKPNQDEFLRARARPAVRTAPVLGAALRAPLCHLLTHRRKARQHRRELLGRNHRHQLPVAPRPLQLPRMCSPSRRRGAQRPPSEWSIFSPCSESLNSSWGTATTGKPFRDFTQAGLPVDDGTRGGHYFPQRQQPVLQLIAEDGKGRVGRNAAGGFAGELQGVSRGRQRGHGVNKQDCKGLRHTLCKRVARFGLCVHLERTFLFVVGGRGASTRTTTAIVSGFVGRAPHGGNRARALNFWCQR
jgi:hypothetical protein